VSGHVTSRQDLSSSRLAALSPLDWTMASSAEGVWEIVRSWRSGGEAPRRCLRLAELIHFGLLRLAMRRMNAPGMS
jgi:hypothetical protein